FLKNVNDKNGEAIGARHITVSISGIAHKIYEFANLGMQINLAISLHAPTDTLLSRIMKINRSFPIEKFFKSNDNYIKETNRRITFEYIMIKDVNDKPEHAEELAKLLQPLRQLAHVNLIPYNPVNEHIQYERSTPEAIVGFETILEENRIK